MRSGAVFNERDIARTLQVLRYELSKAYSGMARSQIGFEEQQLRQHEDLIQLVKDCNELSLMLYSQKQDFTFDLTYALRQVTDKYHNFTDSKMPFDNILSYFDVEIDRYDRLLKALKILPPELMEVPDSLGPSLLGTLATTLHIGAFMDIPLAGPVDGGSGDVPGAIEEELDFQLDSLSQVDRDSCIFYATELLDMFTSLKDMMVKDKDYYETTDTRLREAYNYAQDRYKIVQKKIFVDGGRNYWHILTNLPQSVRRAVGDFHDKYSRDYNGNTIHSEWRGPMVLGFAFIIIVYLLLAAVLSWLVTKSLKRRVSVFRSDSFAMREMAFVILVSLVVFVIIVLLARMSPKVSTHFFTMASSLLVEYAMILVALLTSLIIRFPGKLMGVGLKIYTPVVTMGLLIIAFRIMFIPNSIINLLFPPVLLLFAVWQLVVFRKYSSMIPRVDRGLMWTSLFVTIATFVLSVAGYALMGLQVYIWWIFQIVMLQVIQTVKALLARYRVKNVDKRIRAYRMLHPAEISNDKSAFFLVSWLYDLFDKVIIPLLTLFSIPVCLFLSARVFDLTEVFQTALFYPFLDVKAITLSLYKVLLVAGLFFVFRYLEYMATSLYRVYKMRDAISKSGTGLLRENEVNLTLANNVIWLITWGLYIIVSIGILNIPTKSLEVVTAGLAAGLGFAMKDVLNNFFYGVQLMSGRVRVGDTLECDGIRGTVDNISYQTTTIQAIDGSLIAFPNSVL
ncbi:MAG: mechanosensitive ion channel, partial [Bacteroidales bacterium]|nr:mechanosensitive ion channel [Bacteroidales bacterium]